LQAGAERARLKHGYLQAVAQPIVEENLDAMLTVKKL